jgi:putative transposase
LSALIGVGRYERSDDRTAERNGHRSRVLTTKAGDVDLAIPKLRRGSFFPSILEPRRRIDQAPYAVVMEAYVHGVSTRAVDDLVEAMCSKAGISKSEVSRICAGLDEAVGAFRGRRLDHARFPYIWLDATYLHVRADHQVTSKAVVVATGVTEDGRREILGIEIGDSEDEAFWREFLRSLKRRGLAGVRLVISDQHAGLVAAIRRCFQGAGHLPGPLRPQPVGQYRKGPPRDGLRGLPDDLCPGEPRGDLRPMGSRDGHAHRALRQGRRADGAGQGGSAGL